MSKVKIELNSAGIMEMLKSQEMQDLLEEHAAQIAGRCGEGYEHDVHLTAGRAVASAYTATPAAVRDNLDNNTLLRALG